jgi:hypothetical protein
MDRVRFDSIARSLARRLDRRATLSAALGLAVGGSLVDARAASTCRPGHHTCTRGNQCCSGDCPVGRNVPIHLRNRCSCAGGENLCGNRCVDLATDPRNCGACGVHCSEGTTCQAGVCIGPNACEGSEALFCIVTTDSGIIEFDNLCITSFSASADACLSSAECSDRMAEVDTTEIVSLYGAIEAICAQRITVSGTALPIESTICVLHIIDHDRCITPEA